MKLNLWWWEVIIAKSLLLIVLAVTPFIPVVGLPEWIVALTLLVHLHLVSHYHFVRICPLWNTLLLVKAWFHDGEILRQKFCLWNMDGCTWVILLNFPTLSAFAVSRNFFSRNLICPYCACVNSFRAKFFAFRREKKVLESDKPLCVLRSVHQFSTRLQNLLFARL
jgi:hypothetical protein